MSDRRGHACGGAAGSTAEIFGRLTGMLLVIVAPLVLGLLLLRRPKA